MTALTALMPTHAQFARAAAASRSAPSDREFIRKYIVVERDGREFAFTFPSCIRHDEACPRSAGRLVAAGSYSIINGTVRLTGVGSTTLRLESRPQDAALIEALFSESA